jgi:hypothetical protein
LENICPPGRDLTTVYDIENDWFYELFLSSGTIKTGKPMLRKLTLLLPPGKRRETLALLGLTET